ncbi:MAG: lptB 5, partial [Frankiales bacterium]|nr:lptB 5 [Frankiales bacterium]
MSRRDLTSRTASLTLLAVVLLAPLAMNVPQTAIVTTATCFALVALGLDVLVGSTGQLSLAHAALYGVGCYSALGLGTHGAPWPIVFVGAAAATAVTAVVVGLPALRIRGLQVAIASLAFQQFAIQIPQKWDQVKFAGKTFDPPSYLAGVTAQYYLGVALVVGVLLVLGGLRRTRGGRSLLAVRDVEQRAVAFGVSTGRTKLFAYAVSGAITGLGGALFALQQTSVSDTQPFILQQSLLMVAVVVVGGARSPIGILLAAFATAALPLLLKPSFGQGVQLTIPVILAAVLVISVVLQPEGIGGVLRDVRDRLGGLGERPEPRPQATDPVLAAARARTLREVPRPLTQRLPCPALLVAQKVSVRYGGVIALADVDLEVRRSEIVGLIGANGAGKSTFFNAVS